MNLTQELVKKIEYFRKEIRNLKTAHFKTATTLATASQSGSVSLPLQLFGDPGIYWLVASSKKAVVTLTTTDNTNMISALYLTGVTPSNVDDRRIYVYRVASNPGECKFEIAVYSENQNDYDTLAGGGSINVSYNIQAVGTSNFNVSVTYKDFNPWQD